MRIDKITNVPLARPLMIAGAAALLLGMAACDENPTTVNLTEGQPMLHVDFDALSGTFPSAKFDAGFTFFSIDPTVPDAFGRASGASFQYFSTCPCWGFNDGQVLDASNDPRVPTPSASDISLVDLGSGALVYVLGPGAWPEGENIYDWWAGFAGLPANSTFYVGLIRAGLNVNGELDYNQILLGEPVAQRDELVLIGGSPGGNSVRPANAFNRSTPYPAEPNANPWVLGFITSDANGVAVMDVVHSSFDASSNQVYFTQADGFDPANAPIGPNGLIDFASDQYNYLVVWSEDPLLNPDAQVVFRVHLAADLGQSLTPVNNAFAPYPSAALPLEDYPDAPGALGYPSSLSVELANLPAAGQGAYKLWLLDVVTGERVAAAGDLEVTAADGTVTNVGQQATWTGGSGSTAVFTIDDNSLPSGRVRDFTHVVASVEGDESDSYAFWAEYAAHNGTPDDFADNDYTSSADLTLGRFQADDIADSPIFSIAGNITGSFYKDTLLVVSEGSIRPPFGFEYHVWLRDLSTDPVTMVSAGALDLDENGDGVLRVPVSSVDGDFSAYKSALITLEPAVGDPAEPSVTSLFDSEIWTEKFSEVFGSSGS